MHIIYSQFAILSLQVYFNTSLLPNVFYLDNQINDDCKKSLTFMFNIKRFKHSVTRQERK